MGHPRLDPLDRGDSIGKRETQRPLGVAIGGNEVQMGKGFHEAAPLQAARITGSSSTRVV